MLKPLTLSALFVFSSLISSAQILIGSIALNPSAPNNCSNTAATINMQHFCANYSYTGYTVSTSGSTVTVVLNYSAGPICLPAIVYPSLTVNLGQLPPGSVTIQAQVYLNSTLSSSAMNSTTVTQCCSAIAAYVPSEDTICLDDTITVTNNTSNADSVKWFQNGVLVDTAFSPSLPFNSAGQIVLRLVAYGDTCTDTTNQTIHVMAPPQVSLGNDTSICEGTPLVLTVPGGNNTYLWSDGSTGVVGIIDSVGYIWISASNSFGCSDADTLNVLSVNPAPEINIGSDTIICPNESIQLDAGIGWQNVLWSDSSNSAMISVSLGTYSVTVSNGSCTGADTIVISNHALDPFTAGADTSVCGEHYNEASFGFVNYMWSNGANANGIIVTSSGTYLVTATDNNGCEQVDSVNIEIFDVPDFNLGGDTVLCEENSYTITLDSSYSYLWQDGSTSNTMPITQPGTYWAQGTNALGCTHSDTLVVTFDDCIGVSEFAEHLIRVFPNPAVDAFLIAGDNSPSGPVSVQLLNLHGQIVMSLTANRNQPVDVSHLAKGLYLLKIAEIDGRTQFINLLIQ